MCYKRQSSLTGIETSVTGPCDTAGWTTPISATGVEKAVVFAELLVGKGEPLYGAARPSY